MKLFENIKNVIKWLPIIWNDCDWHWIYWVKINVHKLRSMYNFLNSGDVISEQDPESMAALNELIKLFENLATEKFETDVYESNTPMKDRMNQINLNYDAVIDGIADLLKKYLRDWWD